MRKSGRAADVPEGPVVALVTDVIRDPVAARVGWAAECNLSQRRQCLAAGLSAHRRDQALIAGQPLLTLQMKSDYVIGTGGTQAYLGLATTRRGLGSVQITQRQIIEAAQTVRITPADLARIIANMFLARQADGRRHVRALVGKADIAVEIGAARAEEILMIGDGADFDSAGHAQTLADIVGIQRIIHGERTARGEHRNSIVGAAIIGMRRAVAVRLGM